MPEVRVIQPITIQAADKLRVAAYARVSSDSADQRNSFSAQVKYYTQFIQAHEDWQFVDIYADQGITGTRADKREEFLRLMRDCRAGKIDRILVKSVSRFARNAQDCIKAVRELKDLGVTVAFEKERINTAVMSNEMFLSMMSAFAQEESISISQNMRKGAVMRMQNGTFRLSQPPYGYRLDEGGMLVIQPEEAEIVRRIFESFLSGKGIREIALELETEKIPKRNGTPVWSYTGVLYILSNERYMGDERLQKFRTTDTVPFQKKANNGQLPQYYLENSHEAIVSRELFQMVQELLTKKAEQYGRPDQGSIHSFTGKLICAECGTSFCRRIEKNNRVVWSCRKHFMGKQLCGMESIPEIELQQCFLTLCRKLAWEDSSILHTYLHQMEELKGREFLIHSDVMELNRQIAILSEQNHALHSLWAKECIDSAFFIAQTNELEQKIARLRKDLQQYRDGNDYSGIIEGTKKLIRVLSKPSQEFDGSLFRSIVMQATISHQSIRFQLCNGLELEESRRKGEVS